MSSRAGALAAVVLPIALAGVAASCVRPDVQGVVLVTLDTTRADRLGCYGDASAKTPHLDALAAEGARFTQAQAAATTTLASHTTIFTGLYPPAHGVRYNGVFRVAPQTRTLAEILRERGWMTGAVPAAFPVTAKTGLDKGFETYLDLFSESGGDKLPMRAERKADDVVRKARGWLDGVGDRKFFLWVHLYDPHWPYEPPFPFSAQFRDRPYDGEIAFADQELGALLADLRAKGLWSKTVVVVAGDHGEGLYDHGERQHGSLVYASTLHVPLIVKDAGRTRSVVVEEPVSLADVAPTILDLAGLPLPAGLHGVSLKGALAGDAPRRREIYFESLAGSLNFGWSPLEGILRGKWKLIRSSVPELYDLASDPEERTNVIHREGQLAKDLGEQLDERLAAWTPEAPAPGATRASADAETVARLRSLGYVSGSVGATSREGPPPASMIRLEGELLQLRDLLDAKEWADGLATARRILADDPGNRFALYNGAAAAAAIPDHAAARALAGACVERYAEFTPCVELAAQIEIAGGNLPGAIHILEAALAKTPDEPSLTYTLAVALDANGRSDEARRLVDRALASPDAPASFHVVRALLRAKAGDGDGAMASLRDAFAHGYRDLETLRMEPLLKPLRQTRGFDEALRTIATE